MTSISKKIIMACSGIFLSLFIIVHALGNTTILRGRSCFESYTESLHGLGLALVAAELVLALVFAVHVLMAANLWWLNYRARETGYQVNASAGGRSPGSRTMPYTGLFLLAFIVFHVLIFRLNPGEYASTSDLLRLELASLPIAFFYISAILALFLHLSHGLLSTWQSLGLDIFLRIMPVKKISFAVLILLTFIFLTIVGYALLADGFLL